MLDDVRDDLGGKADAGIMIDGAGIGSCMVANKVPGVRAAKSAGARVIAVPDPVDISNPGFAAADVVLSSLTHFSMEHVR